MVWNLFPFKGDFSFRKSQGPRAPNLGCRGSESPGWFDILPKNSALDMMCEWVHCCDEAANRQLPMAVAFWIIQIVSMEECSSLTQNLMQIHYCTQSVIVNMMTTQYTYSLNGIYCPHWLVQWSHHCSCMHIPVQSPWLPGYINVVQTILVISIVAELCVCVCVYKHIDTENNVVTQTTVWWYQSKSRVVVGGGGQKGGK